MKKYSKLSKKKRCLIESGIKSRKSLREIGRMIDRPAKKVSAEIKRHGGKIGYYAAKAQFCAEFDMYAKTKEIKICSCQNIPIYIRNLKIIAQGKDQNDLSDKRPIMSDLRVLLPENSLIGTVVLDNSLIIDFTDAPLLSVIFNTTSQNRFLNQLDLINKTIHNEITISDYVQPENNIINLSSLDNLKKIKITHWTNEVFGVAEKKRIILPTSVKSLIIQDINHPFNEWEINSENNNEIILDAAELVCRPCSCNSKKFNFHENIKIKEMCYNHYQIEPSTQKECSCSDKTMINYQDYHDLSPNNHQHTEEKKIIKYDTKFIFSVGAYFFLSYILYKYIFQSKEHECVY